MERVYTNSASISTSRPCIWMRFCYRRGGYIHDRGCYGKVCFSEVGCDLGCFVGGFLLSSTSTVILFSRPVLLRGDCWSGIRVVYNMVSVCTYVTPSFLSFSANKPGLRMGVVSCMLDGLGYVGGYVRSLGL